MTTSFPAVAFRSGLIPGFVSPQIPMATVALSVAADGSSWMCDGSSIYSLDPVNGWTSVGDLQTPAGIGQFIAAVSNDLVYGVTLQGSVVHWTTDGGMTTLSPLPDGQSAAMVSAAADGTLWVVSWGNRIYSYSGSAWSEVPSPDGAIASVSVGNSGFAVAMVAPPGDSDPSFMQWNAGASWTSPPSALVTQAYACADGSYWTVGHIGTSDGFVALQEPGGSFLTFAVDDFTELLPPTLYSGPTSMGFYYVSATTVRLRAVAYGILDQPAVAWPAMTGTQLKGYNAISHEVGASGPGGIRAQYSNKNAPFSDWYTDVKTMDQPAGVTASDWTAIHAQILAELKDVTSVNAFFASMATLATNVAIVQTDTYNEVVQLVGLPADTSKQPSTVVSIILGKIYDQLTGAAMDAAPKNVSKALNAGISIFKFSADQIAQHNGAPNCDAAIHLACAHLAGQLAAIVTNNALVAGTMQAKILTDWGKLSACGLAIESGVWYWPPTFDYSVLASIGAPTHMTFYQALMPAVWQIMLLESFDSVPPYAPPYTQLSKTEQDAAGNTLTWWWICAQQGAGVSIDSVGPWPNKNLIDAINTTSVMTDFFTGNNGWTLPVAVMSGYNPPPANLPFNSWVDQG